MVLPSPWPRSKLITQPSQGTPFPGLSLEKTFTVEPGTLGAGLNNTPHDASWGPAIKLPASVIFPSHLPTLQNFGGIVE